MMTARQFRMRLKEAGVSQRKFALWLGLDVGTVNRWANPLGALGTFARFYHGHQQAVQSVTPFEPTPVRVELLNINIELDAVQPLRGDIGTEQGPRRIPGPTIIDQ